MKFNLALGNHPPLAMNTPRDHTLVIKAGIEEAGHFAHLSMHDVFSDAVNVFYDFITPENISYFRDLCERSVRFGLITTEILEDGTLNHRTDAEALARIQATTEIARHAEFLWVMHEPSVDGYKQLCGHSRCHFLPLGYSAQVREIRRFPYDLRDIDFLLFGYLTPYRRKILSALKKRGFAVAHLYDAPGFVRNSMVERTKINLALRQNETWQHPSVGRISYLVTNRCAVIAERTPYGLPYENYTIRAEPDELVEVCADTISNGTYWTLADQYADAFERDFPMGKLMAALIGKTFASP
jgi:hypothetical protein